MTITGTWLGEYTYGELYGNIAGKSVPFTLSLTDSWLGRVTGYVRDDATKGGMPERGRIAGKRKGNAIEFVKTMPVGYVTDPSEALGDKHTRLQRASGIENPRGGPHHIHYFGEIDAAGHTMRGTWIILGSTDATTGETAPLPRGEGSWTARRSSELPSEV